MVNFSNFQKISNFIDRHRNTSAVIVGSAPDISTFPFDTFSGLVFGMGDSPLRGINLFNTDYWVFANAHWLRPWVQRDVSAIKFINPRNTFMSTSIFAFQENTAVRRQLQKAFSESGQNLVFFDQSHSRKSVFCESMKGCCIAKDLLGIDTTIQELLSKRFDQVLRYSNGSTVALHALSLAILMGCNPISIIGVKIPKLQKDYTYYQSPDSDKLVNKFGSCGPFLNSDQDLYPAYLIYMAKALAKSTYKGLQRAPLPFSQKRVTEYEVNSSFFSPDRIQIKADFEFIITNFLASGGAIVNHSKDSLLTEIPGVLNHY